MKIKVTVRDDPKEVFLDFDPDRARHARLASSISKRYGKHINKAHSIEVGTVSFPKPAPGALMVMLRSSR